MTLTCLFIDDEQTAINAVKSYVQALCPEISIVGESTEIKEGIRLINTYKPDILFLDVELKDNKTSFDLLNEVDYKKSKIIFLTGHNDYAIKAFKYCAIDYLLKPIDPDELLTAINKVKSMVSSELFPQQLKELVNSVNLKKKPERIFVKTMDAISAIDVGDIMHIISEGAYSDIYLKSGNKITVTKNIKDFEETLAVCNFFRPHQSYLINMEYFESFKKNDGGYIKMKNGTSIPVSVRKKPEFLEMLKSI
ncbi:MAG: LytTR family DNA-binding domain-containing protein [Bacteroidetes bacterium]|nr:LytTR family DNA-binding domain-containing protein [Bacteroidota bacterium]